MDSNIPFVVSLPFNAPPMLLFIKRTALFANDRFTRDCSVHTPCREGEEVEEPFEIPVPSGCWSQVERPSPAPKKTPGPPLEEMLV